MPNLPANHRPAKKKAHNWQHRKSTTERGYGSQWRKLRASILKRDGYLCQVCKAKGKLTQANEVDHIKEKAHGGTDSPNNLQAICTPCHRNKTAKAHTRR